MLRFYFSAVVLSIVTARADFIHPITIDGQFADWAPVPSHFDPTGGPGVMHDGVPDTHDTDHYEVWEVPSYVDHPDIDLLEYKVAHDHENIYVYFRASGVIGRTIGTSTRHGRYYVIVTVDMDTNNVTGYELSNGGYYPTSSGYDMNMEVEYYDGAFNTGHYLNHGATNEAQLDAAELDQQQGIVRILPGTYSYYSQWVWFDDPNAGDYSLPAPDDFASITFVRDRGPVYQGIVRIARSSDGHEAEMIAPFRGFMRDPAGRPLLGLGSRIDLSFSLEASGELAPGNTWASDTGDPIEGYYLSRFTEPHLRVARAGTDNSIVLSWDEGAMGMRLEQTETLVQPQWQYVEGSNATNQMSLPLQNGNHFFRMVEP